MTSGPTPRPLRALASAAALGMLGVICALVLSACGSTSAASPPATTSTTSSVATGSTGTTTTGAGATGFAAYRACLQQHGVTLPRGSFGFRRAGDGSGATTPSGPTSGAGGRPQLTPAQQQARQACASLRPQGVGAGRLNSNNPAFARFQACLKQHGAQTGGGAGGFSPANRTAFAACRSLLPAGAGRGRGFGGGGSTTANPAFARFQACLKQHGVQSGTGGQSSSKTAAAIAACRSVLPNSGNGSGSATTTTTG